MLCLVVALDSVFEELSYLHLEMPEICPGYNRHALVALLKACAKRKDLRRGSELHAEVVSTGLLSIDGFVGSALLAMYAKCAELEKAQEVFDQIPKKNAVSWNALIDGYVKQGHGEKALHYFEKMQLDGVSPNAITFICLLKACANVEAICNVSDIHAEIARRGFLTQNSNLCCALVDMYAKHGSLTNAQEVLDQIFNCSVDTWNALISGYAKHMLGDEALRCFKKMQLEGIYPDAITFACSLKACGISRDAEVGCQIHVDIAGKGLLDIDVQLGSSLVDMYFKCGLLDKAQEAFDRLLVRDVVSWTTFITGHTDHGHAVEALISFEQMQLEGIWADSITYACSLKACSSIEATSEGIGIHAEVERRGLLHSDMSIGHAVVDMYAMCGLFAKAFEVLNKILIQDVMLWNALISGYVKYEKCEEAFSCIERMQVGGVAPDAITYAFVLKACGSAGATDVGRNVHAEVEIKGLMKGNLFLGNASIDMYGKCGLVAEAHAVLRALPIRDIASWNSIIAGYADHVHGEEALNCFEQMQYEGIFPNSITFSCILKACGSLQAADRGSEIHSELIMRGMLLDNLNPLLGSMVVDMYSKCGFLKEAKDVLEKLPFQSSHSWNALISGYIEFGWEEDAAQLIEKMQQDNLLLDDVTFSFSLKVCGSVGAIREGKDIHGEVERIGLLDSDFVGIALVDMYVKLGLLIHAQEVLSKLPVRDVAAWNALIFGFAKYGQCGDALRCLQQMQLEGVHPDGITITGILKACGKIGAGLKGREMHALNVCTRLLQKSVLVSNALVDMYAKCGWFESAQEVFGKLPTRNVVSWNALISAYAKFDHGKEALFCFKQMQSEGVLPDAITLACSLKACGSIGDIGRGTEIHVDIERKGLMDSDCLIGNALINMYSKQGFLARAQEVFDSLPSRDVVSWNALITGYMTYDQGKEVLTSFEQMQQEGVCLDAISFACILKASGNVGALDQGQEIHAEIGRDGLLLGDLNVCNTIVDMYSKCGSIVKAQEVFNSLRNKDLFSWNTLITGHAQLGDCESVFNTLDQMEGESINPDSVTCLGVLSACNHEGLIYEAELFLNVMWKNWQLIPTVELYTCMVDLLGRAGQLGRAETFIKRVPFHPDVAMLCSLLGACRKWGIVDLATQAFEQAVLYDENDMAAYVYMSNIYADADWWEDAQQKTRIDSVAHCL